MRRHNPRRLAASPICQSKNVDRRVIVESASNNGWTFSLPSNPHEYKTITGSIATSNGMRVRLELRDLPRFSLFPGQIVCVQGQNPSGHCLVARRVIAALPPPMTRSPVSSPAFGGLSAVVASGPFTCAGDLSYEPFLVRKMERGARKKRKHSF